MEHLSTQNKNICDSSYSVNLAKYLHHSKTNNIMNVFDIDKSQDYNNSNHNILDFYAIGGSLPSREHYIQPNFQTSGYF
jgi:predicted metalloendopeptidase